MNTDLEHTHADWLRERFFSDPQRCISLEAGQTLLLPGQHNTRLYMVAEGLLVGSIHNNDGHRYEIFRSGPGKLVGAYSFFSEKHTSYSTVVAEVASRVAFIDKETFQAGADDYEAFNEHVLSAVVEEIYERQLQSHELTIQREEAIQQIASMEKLAVLGQMAAGLAHELNNAIGVIHTSAGSLRERLRVFVQEKDTQGMFPFFETGLETGITLSSAAVRARTRALEARYHLSQPQAKLLAKTGISDEKLDQLGRALPEYVEPVSYYFELGRTLNDMLHASEHAARVVASVQQLGAATRTRPQPVNLNSTIQSALALLKNMSKQVQLELQLGALPDLAANPSDWVQVWVNLLKNALEAMTTTPTPRARLQISSGVEAGFIHISVEDNGPGISAELLPHVFQPNVTTKVEGLTFGLGVGLSIVEKIVESYQGRIEVASRPGKTVFTVKIPI